MRIAWTKQAWFFVCFWREASRAAFQCATTFTEFLVKNSCFFFSRWHACIWKCLLICPWIISHDVHVSGKWHISPLLTVFNAKLQHGLTQFLKNVSSCQGRDNWKNANNLDSQTSASFQLVLTGTQSVQTVLLTLIIAEYRPTLLAVNFLHL